MLHRGETDKGGFVTTRSTVERACRRKPTGIDPSDNWNMASCWNCCLANIDRKLGKAPIKPLLSASTSIHLNEKTASDSDDVHDIQARR